MQIQRRESTYKKVAKPILTISKQHNSIAILAFWIEAIFNYFVSLLVSPIQNDSSCNLHIVDCLLPEKIQQK